ncbi:hypothetical protein PR048_026393 [Dryococelus australis]|uniref:Uncharacterized protein n=1 Tax=Dryococelus australis TaxID=614101 RepID=A0ABQ9GL73_9NEOP|nr:hypothetical protein PR048_026393 [Dryococelus australis]
MRVIEHDSHMRKSEVTRPGIEPGFSLVGGEQANRSATCTRTTACDELLQGKLVLAQSVHSRSTQQEPVTTVQPRETECIPTTHKRAARDTLHVSWSLSNFRTWESCRAMPLFSGFSQGSPFSPALSFQRCYSPHLTLIGSQDIRNLSIHYLFASKHV